MKKISAVLIVAAWLAVLAFEAWPPSLADQPLNMMPISCDDSNGIQIPKCVLMTQHGSNSVIAWNWSSDNVSVGVDRTSGAFSIADTSNGTLLTVTQKAAVQLKAQPFGNLPACAGGNEGSHAAVTDSDVNTWGTTVVHTSGSFHVLAYCDGTNWVVAAP